MKAPPFACPENFSEALSHQGKQEGHWYLFQEGKESLLIHSEEKSVPQLTPSHISVASHGHFPIRS